MTTKYTATGPDGTVYKRATKNRKYTHCVVYHQQPHLWYEGTPHERRTEGGWSCAGWAGNRTLALAVANRVHRACRAVDQVHILEAVEV